MRILVTNDDGIHSPGLWALARALKDKGETVVVAPDRDQSGVGTAFTMLSVVRAEEISPPFEGIRSFSVEGTPADCVILATEALAPGRFDLVVSGINMGANLGLDILNSGTVGGAFQGYIRGIPSIAISVASLTDVRFAAACRAIETLAEVIPKNELPAPLFLNVNVPNVPADSIEGVDLTRLGPRAYLESVQQENDGRRTYYWIRHDRPVGADSAKGTDIWAVRANRISITSLHSLFMTGEAPAEFNVLAEAVAEGLALGERPGE